MLEFLLAAGGASHALVAAIAAFVSWGVTTAYFKRVGAAVATDIALVKEGLPHITPIVREAEKVAKDPAVKASAPGALADLMKSAPKA